MNSKEAKKIRRSYKRKIDAQVGKDIRVKYAELVKQVRFWRIVAGISMLSTGGAVFMFWYLIK